VLKEWVDFFIRILPVWFKSELGFHGKGFKGFKETQTRHNFTLTFINSQPLCI